MRAFLRTEGGSSLVVAVVLIGVMMGLGLGTTAYVDGEQSQSGRERVRESAFNLAESALDSQVLQLARTWANASGIYPTSCTSSSAPSLPCPDAEPLQAAANTADFTPSTCPGGAAPPPWVTSVRDDGGGAGDYYNASVVNAQPAYDANQNGKLWVRASGAARCSQRSVVTMVNQQETTLRIARNVVTANWFRTTNNGKKVIIDTKGGASQPVGLVTRCNGIAPPHTPPSSCQGFNPAKGQVAPNTAEVSTGGPPTAVPPVDLDAFKARAIVLGTYYPAGTCPPSLTGAAVYVEDFTGCATPTAANTDANPGAVYIGRGTFSIGGNSTFYGLLYMGNLQGSSGAVVSLGGTSLIKGAVFIDGLGGLSAGSSKANVIFDDRVFDDFKGLGSVARTPDTWRELPGGQ